MELLDKSLLVITVLQITSLQCMPRNVNAKPLQNRTKRISAFRLGNSMSKTYEIPTVITPNRVEKKSSNLLTKILKEAKAKYGDIAKDTCEPLPKPFRTTPQPYCFKDVGTFPEVEYPMLVADTWMPNYWKRLPTPQQQTNTTRPKEKGDSIYIKPSNKAIQKAVRALIKAQENKKEVQSLQSSYSNDFGPPPLKIPENELYETTTTSAYIPDEINQLSYPTDVTPAYTATTPMPSKGSETNNDKAPYTDKDIPLDGLPVIDEVPQQPADDTLTDPVGELSDSPITVLTDPVGVLPSMSTDQVKGLPDSPTEVLMPSTPTDPVKGLPDSPTEALMPSMPTDPVKGVPDSPTAALMPSMPTDPVRGLPDSPTEALMPSMPTDPVKGLPDSLTEALMPSMPTDPVKGLPDSPTEALIPSMPIDPVKGLPDSPTEALMPSMPTDPVKGLPDSPTEALMPSMPTDPVKGLPDSPTEALIPSMPIDPVKGLPDSPTEALTDPVGVLPDDDAVTDPVGDLSESPDAMLTDPVEELSGSSADDITNPAGPFPGLPAETLTDSPADDLVDPVSPDGILGGPFSAADIETPEKSSDPLTSSSDSVPGASSSDCESCDETNTSNTPENPKLSPTDLSAMEPGSDSFISTNEYDITTMPPDILAFDNTPQKVDPEDVTTKLSPEDWTEFILV